MRVGDHGEKEIPAGRYIVEVADAAFRKKGGKEDLDSGYEADYINFRLKIIEGPSKGGAIWDITSLKDNALWRLSDLAKACGHSDDYEFDERTYDGINTTFLDKKLAVVVNEEEYNNKMRPKVQGYQKLTEVEMRAVGNPGDLPF